MQVAKLAHTKSSCQPLRTAIWYAHELDWPLFPLHGISEEGGCTCSLGRVCSHPGKHPSVRNWQRAATTSEKQVEKWANRFPLANPGIPTGRRTHILVLDIDPRNGGSVAALESEFGALPETPAVATGGDGEHRFFRLPDGATIGNKTAIRPGVDIKGDGGLVVVPPARHVSGKDYAWKLEPFAVPFAEPPDWLSLFYSASDFFGGGDSSVSDFGKTQAKHIACVKLALKGVSASLSEAIAGTIPTAFGTRNRRIFDLARILKSSIETANKRPIDLRHIVEQWHRLALPSIKTKGFPETWTDFSLAWDRVRRPVGPRLADIAASASAAVAPEWASVYDDDRIGQLVCLLAELQCVNDGRPFFIGCRQIGKIFDVSHMTANEWMRRLERDGVIERVFTGHTGRASEFRFIGGPA